MTQVRLISPLLSGEFVDKYRNNKEEFGAYSETSTFYLRLNQKRGGQDTPLKSKKLRKQATLSIDKKALTNVILNDGSKPVDYLVPKGLASGPDGKDFAETFKKWFKNKTPKSSGSSGKKRKRTWKDIKSQLNWLNYDTSDAKKLGSM
ncbi:ABC transporter substrate-binding protein [Bacillus cereus]